MPNATLKITSLSSGKAYTINSVRKTFNLSYKLTNCSGSGSNPTTINRNSSETLYFTVVDPYSLPTEVSVSGATKESWDSSTGKLVIKNPTVDVVVTIAGIEGSIVSYNISDDSWVHDWAALSIYKSDSSGTKGSLITTLSLPDKYVVYTGTFMKPSDVTYMLIDGVDTRGGINSSTGISEAGRISYEAAAYLLVKFNTQPYFLMFRTGCFIAGTLLQTPTGWIKIEDINIGDKVLAYNSETNQYEEDKIVDFLIYNGNNNIANIITEDGHNIGVTKQHSFITKDGWKCIAPNEHTPKSTKLEIGDHILLSNNEYTKVTNILNNLEVQPVYHIILKNNDCVLVSDKENLTPMIAEHYNNEMEEICTY